MARVNLVTPAIRQNFPAQRIVTHQSCADERNAFAPRLGEIQQRRYKPAPPVKALILAADIGELLTPGIDVTMSLTWSMIQLPPASTPLRAIEWF